MVTRYQHAYSTLTSRSWGHNDCKFATATVMVMGVVVVLLMERGWENSDPLV